MGGWWYNPSGLTYLSGQETRDDDRSRTPLRKGKGKGDPNEDPKGKGFGKKGKKPAKIIGSPEGEELERVGRKFFSGPATLPESWRERKPKEIVVSGSIEERPGQATMVFKQGANGIPIFRRTWISSAVPVRKFWVLDNKAGDPRLRDPSDTDFWSVCQPIISVEGDVMYRAATPGEDVRCRLCPNARSHELVPCCWCDSWVHWRCSYTVKSGRASASHFQVLNALDKVVITRNDDETVLDDHRGLQVVPNTFYPRASKNTLKPSDLMIGFETYWAYKHARRGAGYYYKKGDHIPLTKGGDVSLANALSIVAAWETWYLPRPQPVDPVLVTSPDAWELDAHYPDNFGQPTFPSRSIPISMASREANLIGYLSPSKGNLWKLLYDTMHPLIQNYWKYAHQYAVQNSHTNTEYCSWDKYVGELETVDLSGVHWDPPKEFDSRFHYYLEELNLTGPLSTDEGRQTTEEDEVAKAGLYGMNEFPSLETRLIPEVMGTAFEDIGGLWSDSTQPNGV